MDFKIATASSAKSTSWKNRSYSWDELTEKLTRAKVTDETYREFISASKAEQGNIKDVGAFMGGELFGSRRNKNNVGERSILALDIDYKNPKNSQYDALAKSWGDLCMRWLHFYGF